MKLVLLRRYLEDRVRRGEDPIVVAMDGFDVLLLRRREDFLAQWETFEGKIVFGAEAGLRILDPNTKSYGERYPASPTPYRYLTSGAFMGRARALLEVLEQFEELYPHNHSDSDQTLWSMYFVDHPGSITLDYEQRLFANAGGRTFWKDYPLSWRTTRRYEVETWLCRDMCLESDYAVRDGDLESRRDHRRLVSLSISGSG